MHMKSSHRSLAVLLVAAVAALTLAAAAVARPGHGEPGHMGPMAEKFMEHRLHRLGEYLELTDSQRAEAEALHDRLFADMRERHEAVAASFERLHQMVEAESPDATAIGELVIEMHREREAMQAQHEAYFAEFERLLTPEQAERLEVWKAAREMGGFGHHPRMRGFHGGPGDE